MNLKSATIEFRVNNKKISFIIYHNLPEIHGLSLNSAVTNWIYRTNQYNAKSLCDYIKNKNTKHICMTEKTFKKLNNEYETY